MRDDRHGGQVSSGGRLGDDGQLLTSFKYKRLERLSLHSSDTINYETVTFDNYLNTRDMYINLVSL